MPTTRVPGVARPDIRLKGAIADIRGGNWGTRDYSPGTRARSEPYQLLGQLGSGGMGQVFLGMSAGGRPIAVKVIRTELATDPEFRARFRREVAAAQKEADCSPRSWLTRTWTARCPGWPRPMSPGLR